ncbi:noelin-2b isoform X2 [Electrophorus electricus]|uniref:noelin-2b isoform X2 n=1 Tax=Electrophorus electricus TaxID=8005 RepID=UPI0015CF90A6|nr:noelin-2b isoform X2 [Electrophorus electricus]
MSVPILKIGMVLSTMAMVTNWMSQTLPSLVGLNQTLARPGTSERIISAVYPGQEEGWQVFGSVSDVEGKCVCTLLAPPQNLCKKDPRHKRLRQLTEHVQNVSQYLEVLDLRTSRDLQYIRDSEKQLISVEIRVRSAHSILHSITTEGLQELKQSVLKCLPLLAVLSQFRADVAQLEHLQQEVERLRSGLSLLQEQMEAYDYYQLQHRALLLEDRLQTCVNTVGCGKLTGISHPVTIRSFGSRFGSWMMDSMILSSDNRVWSMDGYYRGRRVLEYSSLSDFTKGQNFVVHQLPHPWAGTGHVVYNGSLYYNKHQTNIIVQYNLHSRTVTLQRNLGQAGYNNTFPYSWGGSSDIDLMADESGLWAVYTTIPNGGNLVVSRLDPTTLEVLKSWDTGFPKRSAGEAFLICGTLYVTNSHLAGAKVHFAYNTNTSEYEYTDVPFHNLYSHISMLDYNPRERVLYTWNNGHQVLYNVTLFHIIKSFADT